MNYEFRVFYVAYVQFPITVVLHLSIVLVNEC